MIIKTATFVKSSDKLAICPTPDRPEFAFIGRSNVGKSSLINMLCDKKDLAKTSGKPGKTQLINHFSINDNWYLVDLPGYGYASVSKDKRYTFEKMISSYITSRSNLVCLFVLVDSRLQLQAIDAEFMNWLGKQNIPFCMVYTKTDKLTKNQLQKNLEAYENQLLRTWEEPPHSFVTSAETKLGKEDILNYIESNFAYFKPN